MTAVNLGGSDCESTMHVGSPVIQAATEALLNPLLLRKIFQYTKPEDLLNLSLVNKIWNSIARWTLREKGTCSAAIGRTSTCMELLQLAEILKSSENHPYSGIVIRTGPRHRCTAVKNCEENYSPILKKIQIQRLEIHWSISNGSPCAAETFIGEILRKRGKLLVELKITALPREIKTPLRKTFGKGVIHWLPNLKILDVPPHWDQRLEEDFSRSLKFEIIEAAPQLQTLYGLNGSADLKYFQGSNKIAAIKEFEYHPAYSTNDEPSNLLREFLRQDPKLERLQLGDHHLYFYHTNSGVELMVQFLKSLFSSISTCLRTLHLDLPQLVHFLPKLLLQPLISLERLHLTYSESLDTNVGTFSLDKVNWAWFPALKVVNISTNSREITVTKYTREEPENSPGTTWENLTLEVQRMPNSQSCETVRKIVLENYFHAKCFSRFGNLNKTFPNVREVEIKEIFPLGDTLKLIWVTWPRLECLTLVVRTFSDICMNEDATFCGITKETLLRLTAKDGKFSEFERDGPSIVMLKDLKTLRIKVIHSRGNCLPIEEQNKKFLISTFTCINSFETMPDLRVEVERNLCKDSHGNVICGLTLEHLSPYADMTESRKWS